MSYAQSELDPASGVSASEYSSGEEEGDRDMAGAVGDRSGTARGRQAVGDQSAATSQASQVSKGAGATGATGSGPNKGGKRRPSMPSRGQTNQSERDKSKVRRASVARDRNEYDDGEDDDGRFGPLDDEDDEVYPQDRGEELVRRRMKARAREKAVRKKAEKEKEKQQQQQQQLARLQAAQQSQGSQPMSPRSQSVNRQSIVSASPQLEREGRPTYIALPGPDMPSSLPALSPLLPVSPGTKGAMHYPSPHSHIRRPSGRTAEPVVASAGRRVSTTSGGAYSSTVGPVSRGQTQGVSTPQLAPGQDVFSEADVSEPGTSSSFRDGSTVPDEDDEERDTVAGLATDVAQRGDQSLLENVEGDTEGRQDDVDAGEEDGEDLSPSLSGEGLSDDDVEYTLKDRQDAINIEHPFGLPIWKPALYKKSRTVTRNAESALHSIPSAAAERHLLPANLLWTIFAGLWLSIVCFIGAIVINCIPYGGAKYARVIWELGGYLFWPFGKYVEVEVGPQSGQRSHTTMSGCEADERYDSALSPAATRYTQDQQLGAVPSTQEPGSLDLSRSNTVRPGDTIEAYKNLRDERQGSSSTSPDAQPAPNEEGSSEQTPLKGKTKCYGAMDGKAPLTTAQRIEEEVDIYGYVHDENGSDIGRYNRILGTVAYGLLFWLLVAPLMGIICLACWGLVFPIPMAKLTWVLLKSLSVRPLALHFRSAPGMKDSREGEDEEAGNLRKGNTNSFLRPLKPGQFAPRSTQPTSDGRLYRRSKILLCTYRAMGLQYYKYTVGGVNILFINTLPFVFFTIFDFFFVEPYVHKHHLKPGFLTAISSQGAMFVFALGSVIPLSYFIGMAVASISAQSSIGMGAVINATFGSIVEIILYAIALTQHKARLVEGSIIGSILAGVLLMPGISMCSGATRRKEQRFNARSAGVTSTMLIMAIIGILTPTLFYQIYGTFQLTCKGCPTDSMPGDSWTCKRCFYEHVPPATDPFYQENVKGLMYTCTVILVLSYGIGLWFSLRTHASQIWQNPLPVAVPAAQQAPAIVPGASQAAAPTTHNALGQFPASHRASIYKRLLPASVVQQLMPNSNARPQSQSQTLRSNKSGGTGADRDSNFGGPMQMPEGLSQEEYERAITLTASAFHNAFRQQQQQQHSQQQSSHSQSTALPPQQSRDAHGSQSTTLARNSAMPHDAIRRTSLHEGGAAEEAASGGHDAPSWTRATSLIVLLSCTVLYAIIAEILVDAVDVVLDGSGLDIKLLGVTLFALVPNATEFMNAMSFAINGNIALSMEIGSAYALQVCLIQIPAMVAFSAFYNANREADVHNSFTLIFPRWDVIAIIFAIFLLTYTYIEARSNYFRGSLCILSYVVLVSGFVFAPNTGDTENPGEDNEGAGSGLLSTASWGVAKGAFGASPLATGSHTTAFGGLRDSMAAHPAVVGATWLQAVVASLWYR